MLPAIAEICEAISNLLLIQQEAVLAHAPHNAASVARVTANDGCTAGASDAPGTIFTFLRSERSETEIKYSLQVNFQGLFSGAMSAMLVSGRVPFF